VLCDRGGNLTRGAAIPSVGQGHHRLFEIGLDTRRDDNAPLRVTSSTLTAYVLRLVGSVTFRACPRRRSRSRISP
jgi:hypothetical protein